MAATALKSRDFESYFLEYTLLSTEVEINAYWKRMDEIIANMSDTDKETFFDQLDKSLQMEVEESRKLRNEIEAIFRKDQSA